MKLIFPSSGRSISGEVCFVRLKVTREQGGPWDDKFLYFLDEGRYKLRDELLQTVRETLGQAFEIRAVTFGRGSIEIIVVIGTAYYVISKYKNFVESIELMVRQFREIVRHFFDEMAPIHVDVETSWTLGRALLEPRIVSHEPLVDRNVLSLWYIIISHAAMLTVILWLFLNRLQP